MNKRDPLLKAALLIHRHLARSRQTTPPSLARTVVGLLEDQETLQRAWRQLARAEQKGWYLAADHLRKQIFDVLQSLHFRLAELPARSPTPQPLSLRALVEELNQLHDDFEPVEIRPKEAILAVVTEPITLEEIDLGPFEIQLHLHRLSNRPGSGCFDCVALEPNPASTSEDVTHPHVKAEQLCAGEATAPIASALAQGRIGDAFALVAAVLRTYNPHSPYVSLADWNGSACHDCGRLVNSSDLYTCESCGEEFCDDCTTCCELCDRVICSSCQEQDEVSGRYCCRSCRRTCRSCGRTVDVDSFIEESHLCPECHEKEKDHEPEETQATATPA